MNYLVRDREVIFNLAGQVSHIDSMLDPFTDLEINCRSQLTILEACRQNNPAAKVVYAGTRQVYGKPDYLPVDERHLVRPTDVNGINKVAGEYYHLVYNNVFGVRGVLAAPDQRLRPAAARSSTTGRASSAGSSASRSRTARSRSSATARRCATSSTWTMPRMRSCGPAPATPATARCSTSAAPSRSATATWSPLLLEVAGTGRVTYREWPPEKKAIDIGSFYSDSRKFQDATGWTAPVSAARGAGAHGRVLPRVTSPTTSTATRDAPPLPEAPLVAFASGVSRMPARIPFNSLLPLDDAAAVNAAIRRVDRPRPGTSSARRSRRSSRSGRTPAAPRTPSAWAPAPTPSRSRCARPASAPETRSSPRRCRPPTRRWP